MSLLQEVGDNKKEGDGFLELFDGAVYLVFDRFQGNGEVGGYFPVGKAVDPVLDDLFSFGGEMLYGPVHDVSRFAFLGYVGGVR